MTISGVRPRAAHKPVATATGSMCQWQGGHCTGLSRHAGVCPRDVF